MKAAVLRSIPGDLVIEEVEVGEIGPFEVLIRTAAAGVCHSDHHYLVGKYTTPLPTVMGHEASGVVEAVGDQVRHVKPGDHAVTCLSVFCGRCEYCLTGRMSLCSQEGTARQDGSARLSKSGEAIHPYSAIGAFAEQMLVHENAVVKIDRDIPLSTAATVGCAVITGLGSVFNTAKVEPGSTVAVIGTGGIGLNVVQGSILAGASRVIAIDVHESKLATAISFGATDTLLAGTNTIEETIELTGGGVDYAFDAVGTTSTARQAFDALRPGGTAVLIGMIPLGDEVSFPGVDFLYEKTVKGSNMGSTRSRVDIPRYLDLYKAGRIELDALISRSRPLEEIGDAMSDLESGILARTIITFES